MGALASGVNWPCVVCAKAGPASVSALPRKRAATPGREALRNVKSIAFDYNSGQYRPHACASTLARCGKSVIYSSVSPPLGLTMKTKAAVAYKAGQPLVMADVNLDGPKPGEVLVEIKASGVCHTDDFTRSAADHE